MLLQMVARWHVFFTDGCAVACVLSLWCIRFHSPAVVLSFTFLPNTPWSGHVGSSPEAKIGLGGGTLAAVAAGVSVAVSV